MPSSSKPISGVPPKISLSLAVLPLVTMVGLFAMGAAFLEMSTELLILVMLSSAAVAGRVARHMGKSREDIQTSPGQKLASVLPAILILLSIGMLIGTWVASGTIPMLG